MYKEASRVKLRIETPRGLLSPEQLWDLPLTDLDTLAVSLEKDYKAAKGAKSFLSVKTVADKTAKLKFDIVLDILESKVKEQEEARNAAADKEHNQKILSLIAKKKEQSLEELSVEELEAQLK